MYVTKEGYKRLEEELNRIIQERNDMTKTLAEEAMSDGYFDARENSVFLEKRTRFQQEYAVRIAELRNILANVRIVEDQDDLSEEERSEIRIGSKVTVMADGESFAITIVGKLEGNPRKAMISYESPVGKALIGHKPGDTVNIETPGGISEYKILEIE